MDKVVFREPIGLLWYSSFGDQFIDFTICLSCLEAFASKNIH